jgi:hypothetical protein
MKQMKDKANESEFKEKFEKLEKKYSIKEKAYMTTYNELKDLKVEF